VGEKQSFLLCLPLYSTPLIRISLRGGMTLFFDGRTPSRRFFPLFLPSDTPAYEGLVTRRQPAISCVSLQCAALVEYGLPLLVRPTIPPVRPMRIITGSKSPESLCFSFKSGTCFPSRPRLILYLIFLCSLPDMTPLTKVSIL